MLHHFTGAQTLLGIEVLPPHIIIVIPIYETTTTTLQSGVASDAMLRMRASFSAAPGKQRRQLEVLWRPKQKGK